MKIFRCFKMLVVSVVSLAVLNSCGVKTESEIVDEVESGVVLVLNRSYYEFKMPNGESLYFTNYDSEDGIKGLVTDEDSVEYAVSYGTGFFIDGNGKIATNAHVITSTDNASDINSAMSDVFAAIKYMIAQEYYEYSDRYDQACSLANEAYYDNSVSASDYHYICSIRDALKSEMEDLVSSFNQLDNLNVRDCDIIYHNVISVAFNDTYVENFNDFAGCVIKKCDEVHDVAIIQLKDKKTPDGRYVFDVPSDNPLETYGVGDKISKSFGNDKNERLILIGFNYGPLLALTSEGVKCQHTSGSISQDGSDHLMYSIPALHGSSGSPVVNMKGELVAVNFAGISTTQSFTYGVYVKHLRKLMDELD